MNVAQISAELQVLQKLRIRYTKFRIMNSNFLEAIVAGTLGYHAGMKKKDRTKMFKEAKQLITSIVKGEAEPNPLVLTASDAIQNFRREQDAIEKEMVKLAKQLPVAAWVEQPEQRGFGMLFLAIIIGETGDLSGYANPGKVWRRMGCAPYTQHGLTLMGATWKGRQNGKRGEKLHASDWEDFGYSPRRRSISFLIGEGIVKQNWIGANGDVSTETESRDAVSHQSDRLYTSRDFDPKAEGKTAGPYRARYDETKALAAKHNPDWIRCGKCDGTGKKERKKCENCSGTGEVWMHCHRHGMLLATKLLLKELWIQWNQRDGDLPFETEYRHAVPAGSAV